LDIQVGNQFCGKQLREYFLIFGLGKIINPMKKQHYYFATWKSNEGWEGNLMVKADNAEEASKEMNIKIRGVIGNKSFHFTNFKKIE